jgi:hypothetical protein
MDDSAFDVMEQAARSHGPEAVFDFIIGKALEERNHQMLFGARILRVRHRLGLPLVDSDTVLALTDEQRQTYEEAFNAAAREAGELSLTSSDIVGAWPYFKAINDPAPVAAAIDRADQAENIDRIIEIAYLEGVNRNKGFELCLKHHGICSAITWFASNPDPASRQHCLELLVSTIYNHVASALKETITATEGAAPSQKAISELMSNRGWLFEGTSSYIDSTHLTAVLRYAPELRDPRTLRMAGELAEYGCHLNPMFHFRGDPPFEDTYRDHAVYLRTLIGENPEAGISHFRAKIRAKGDTIPARIFIELLKRLGQYRDAIEAALEYLPPGSEPENAALALQLCQQARDYKTLRRLAREQKDLLGFAAGIIQDDRN